jgi:hypothetical protein
MSGMIGRLGRNDSWSVDLEDVGHNSIVQPIEIVCPVRLQQTYQKC